MLFLDARHGNEEDFKLHLDVYRSVTSAGEMQNDLAFGPNGHSLVVDAIHGDNPAIFDAVLQLEDLSVSQMIELESDDSDTDADDEDDSVLQNGLKHVSSRSKKHSRREDNGVHTLWERMAARKNGPLPRRYTLGTKLLRFAIFHSATSIVEHLIRVHGIRDEIPDGFQSALHLAVDGGHQNLITMLLECAGSRIDARDHHRVTPLELAWKKEFDRVAAALIIYGADFSAQDYQHRNSVFHASRFGQVALLKFMAMRSQEQGIDFQQLTLIPERHTLNTALHVCADQQTFDFFRVELRMQINLPLNANNETPEDVFHQCFFK
jgi:hypothetical protein